MNVKMTALKILEVEEGYRENAYLDTLGYWTIGFGYCLGKQGLSKFTAGDFNNKRSRAEVQAMVDGVLSGAEPRAYWHNKLIEYVETLELTFENNKNLEYKALPDNIKLAFILLGYQMGVHNLYKFKNMLRAIKVKDFGMAAFELLDSDYSTQTPKRALRVARLIAKGNL